MTSVQALVVGAGPAGSASASFLARLGWDVLIVDRRSQIEQKICGECLSPASRPLLELLGAASKISADSITQLKGIRLVGPNGSVCDLDFGKDPPFSIPRPILDRALLSSADDAGAQIKLGTTVNRITKHREKFKISLSGNAKSEVEADIVVGADGRNSWTAKELGLATRAPHSLQHSAVMAFFSSPEKPLLGVEMHVCPWGYVGLNPVSDQYVNVIAVLSPTELRKRLKRGGKAELIPFLRDHVLGEYAPTSLKERMKNSTVTSRTWTVSQMAWSPAQVTGAQSALVGDSAGFIDPFTGEGLFHALSSAYELSRQLEKHGIPNGLKNYSTWHSKAFGPEERFCSLLQKLLPYSSLTDYGIRQLGRKSKLNSILAETIADRLPTQKVLSPWFWGKVLLP